MIANGGRVETMDFIEGYSSTNIINKINSLAIKSDELKGKKKEKKSPVNYDHNMLA